MSRKKTKSTTTLAKTSNTKLLGKRSLTVKRDYGYIKDPAIPEVSFPELFITRGLFEQFAHAADGYKGNEVAWYSCCKYNEELNIITMSGDIIIPPQDVDKTNTVSSPEDEIQMLFNVTDEQSETMSCHTHTHVDIGAFASGVDNDQAVAFMEQYKNKFKFVVKIIINRQLAVFAQVLHPETMLARKTELNILPVTDAEVFDRITKEIADRCRIMKPVYTPPPTTSYGRKAGHGAYGRGAYGRGAYGNTGGIADKEVGSDPLIDPLNDDEMAGTSISDYAGIDNDHLSPDYIYQLDDLAIDRILRLNGIAPNGFPMNALATFDTTGSSTSRATQMTRASLIGVHKFRSAGMFAVTTEQWASFGCRNALTTVMINLDNFILLYTTSSDTPNLYILTDVKVLPLGGVPQHEMLPFYFDSVIYDTDLKQHGLLTTWQADEIVDLSVQAADDTTKNTCGVAPFLNFSTFIVEKKDFYADCEFIGGSDGYVALSKQSTIWEKMVGSKLSNTNH